MTQQDWKPSIEEKSQFTHSFYVRFSECLTASVLGHYGQDGIAQLHWQLMRQMQDTQFLPGLKMFDLEREETDAIAAAKFHVLVNEMVGLDMEFIEETPEKVWIIYKTGFWGAVGGALAPKSIQVIFSAWHGHNGPSMGNPRLGYVLTHLQCQGDAYDAGYFKIYDHDLRHPEQTLQFSQGERIPRGDPSKAPAFPAFITPERRIKALRNFGVSYVNEIMGIMLDMYGVGEACRLIEHAAAVSMTIQRRALVDALGLQDFSAAGIATFIQRDRALLDEEVTIEKVSQDEYVVRQEARNPRLFPDLARTPAAVDEALLKGWRTFIDLTNRDLAIDMTAALTAGDPHYEWVIRPRRS